MKETLVNRNSVLVYNRQLYNVIFIGVVLLVRLWRGMYMYEKKKTLCDLFPGITKLLVDIRTIFNKIINAIKNKSRSHIIFSTVYTIFIFAVSTLICHNSNILVLALICLNVIISSFVISIEIASISSSIFWYYKIKYLN